MLVVELGIKLDKDIEYYQKNLIKNNLKLLFECTTHDIYYTNVNLDNMTENEMKNACIRIRSVNDGDYKIQNDINNLIGKDSVLKNELKDIDSLLLKLGYRQVFDTKKKDFQYGNDFIKNRVQLQKIEDVGLLVYYDNKDYYNLSLEDQRKKLIAELNSYGFNIKPLTLGLDKLRTLYYGKEMYSKNQY